MARVIFLWHRNCYKILEANKFLEDIMAKFQIIVSVEVVEVPTGLDVLTKGTRKELDALGCIMTEDAVKAAKEGKLKKKATMEVLDADATGWGQG